jgi:hypothetical protein
MSNTCEIKERPKTIKAFITSWYFWKPALATLAGAIAGFAYYWYVGCNSGSCPITSNPYISIIWGGLLGLFLVKSPCSKC